MDNNLSELYTLAEWEAWDARRLERVRYSPFFRCILVGIPQELIDQGEPIKIPEPGTWPPTPPSPPE